jgi:hypothetical protein
MAYQFVTRVAGAHPMTEPWDQWGIHGGVEADASAPAPDLPLLERYPDTPEREAVFLRLEAELEAEDQD